MALCVPAALVTLLFCGVLLTHGSLGDAYGPRVHACCEQYTVRPIPLQRIKGVIEQRSREYCRIDAVIFITTLNRKVCASVRDQWVRVAIAHLSSKLKRLSKVPVYVKAAATVAPDNKAGSLPGNPPLP